MDRIGFDRIKHKVLNFKLKGDKNMIIKEDKFLQFNEQIKQQGGCKKVSLEEGEQIAAELLEELTKSKGNTKIIPYNENRAVLFNSNLFHQTDTYEFKEGYENRRINVTMLFGKRENS